MVDQLLMPNLLNASAHLVLAIKGFENIRLKAYKDPGGVATIGYGHTTGVFLGDVITYQRADDFLMQDLQVAHAGIIKDVAVPLSQGQFDCLMDFTFNVGVPKMTRSDVIKAVNEKDWDLARRRLLNWCHVGTEVLPGLLARRKEECSWSTTY